MSFLRCNPEHHSIAFNAAPARGVQPHLVDDGIDRRTLPRARARARVRFAADVGHRPPRPGIAGLQLLHRTSGYVVELIADGVEIADDAAWQPTVWERKPEFMDLWGTSGPPGPEIREAMAGVPDPGHETAAFERSRFGATGIVKRFGPVVALNDVSFACESGEIHALPR